MEAIKLISKERDRQIKKENWSLSHDDEHTEGALAALASTYAWPVNDRRVKRYQMNPFDKEWLKETPDNRIKELTKAGALIIAEIERLQRLEDK